MVVDYDCLRQVSSYLSHLFELRTHIKNEPLNNNTGTSYIVTLLKTSMVGGIALASDTLLTHLYNSIYTVVTHY